MYLQDAAVGVVQPGNQDELIAGSYAVQRRQEGIVYIEPGVGSTLVALPRRFGEVA
jgi:hypothetical protein